MSSDVIFGSWLILMALLVMFIITLRKISFERKQYNKGICTKCGKKLEFYMYNRKTWERGYCCRNCNRIIWVGFKIVDKNLIDKFLE